jgi:hypothetical protein
MSTVRIAHPDGASLTGGEHALRGGDCQATPV